MEKRKSPARWGSYVAFKDVIEGTRFLPFKTPFSRPVRSQTGALESFNALDLLNRVGNLGLVVNLVNTDRYYNTQIFKEKGVEFYHNKLRGGGRIPSESEISNIFKLLDSFISRNADDKRKLIGVHCTHGVNRTGYLICRYMICELGFTPREAIARFTEGRGHSFDHDEYVEDLLNLTPAKNKKAKKWHSIGGQVIPRVEDDESDFDPDQLDHLQNAMKQKMSVQEYGAASKLNVDETQNRNVSETPLNNGLYTPFEDDQFSWKFVGPRKRRPKFQREQYLGPSQRDRLS